MGLLFSLNKYLESLQGSSQICATRVFKIKNHTLESNSVDSQFGSYESLKDGQEGLARVAVKFLTTDQEKMTLVRFYPKSLPTSNSHKFLQTVSRSARRHREEEKDQDVMI